MMKISRYFDAAVLKPNMTEDEVKAAIQTCIDTDSYSACVRPCDLELAISMCEGTNTIPICVLDFPHGDSTAEGKAALADLYAAKGAKEIDMVVNIGYVRSGKWEAVEKEVRGVVEAAAKYQVPVKVILETCYLTREEIMEATRACVRAGAAFVKTSTGFAPSGASFEAVEAMLEAGEGRIKVKPSGGIRDYATARRYVEMGASRLGIGFGSAAAIIAGEESGAC